MTQPVAAPIADLNDFLGRWYVARVLHRGTTDEVATAFAEAAKANVALVEEARARLADLDEIGMDDDDLKKRDYASWAVRDGLRAVLNG